jgi:hypothetical protein
MKITLQTFFDHKEKKYVSMFQYDGIEFFEFYNETKEEAIISRDGYAIFLEVFRDANVDVELVKEIGDYLKDIVK